MNDENGYNLVILGVFCLLEVQAKPEYLNG